MMGSVIWSQDASSGRSRGRGQGVMVMVMVMVGPIPATERGDRGRGVAIGSRVEGRGDGRRRARTGRRVEECVHRPAKSLEASRNASAWRVEPEKR